MKTIYTLFFLAIAIVSCKKKEEKKETVLITQKTEIESSNVEITPISHATAVLEFDDLTIYMDPTGGAKAFETFNTPDFVVITDIHGDHMNLKTLNELNLTNTTVIAPEAVAKEIKTVNTKEVIIINNGEIKEFDDFSIEAIPMYNLRKEALKFHTKGRGNGYVFTINDERIYFSGDTEDIPEMRNLENIDRAYVCMNLPYTMTVESAADGVLAFKPKKVYPYHYRGTNGLSDVEKFKEIITNQDTSIEVVQLDWYPKK